MRLMLDSTCKRCGWTSTLTEVSIELAREFAKDHVCADGVRGEMREPVERRVPGPGERTKLPEERGQC